MQQECGDLPKGQTCQVIGNMPDGTKIYQPYHGSMFEIIGPVVVYLNFDATNRLPDSELLKVMQSVKQVN